MERIEVEMFPETAAGYAAIMTPEEIRAWRRAHRLTQAQLAELLGLNVLTISAWETGRQRPPGALLDLALPELHRRLQQERGESSQTADNDEQ